MRKMFSIISAAFLILSSTLPAYSQAKKSPRLKDEVELPTDFAIDFQLGLSERSKIRGGNSLLVGTELNQVGEEVFRNLIDNPTISGFGLPYRWSFTIINKGWINAYSLSDGEVSVGSGLAEMIGSNRGLWAAALSHEVAHVAGRHSVKKYLFDLYIAQQIQYYKLRAAYGDKSANWALLGLQIAAPIARAKLSRDLEHAADMQGMMLMARAGFHPDNVFALHHLLRLSTGEQSKFAAFFSGHPRWETRDQRSERAYADALGEFNRLWLNARSSPGGVPPPVAFLGQPRAVENKSQGTADLILPLACRNLDGAVTLVIRFSRDNVPVKSQNPDYLDSAGNLQIQAPTNCQDKEDTPLPVTVHLPANLVSERDRKLKARVVVVGPANELLEATNKEFDVHFPKLDRKRGEPLEQESASVRVDGPGGEQSVAQTAQAPSGAIGNAQTASAATKPAENQTATREIPEAVKPTSAINMSLAPSPPATGISIGISGKANGPSGIEITEIQPQGPAAQAGLQVGDILTEVEGIPVNTVQALGAELASHGRGATVKVTYLRRAWSLTANVTIGGSAQR